MEVSEVRDNLWKVLAEIFDGERSLQREILQIVVEDQRAFFPIISFVSSS